MAAENRFPQVGWLPSLQARAGLREPTPMVGGNLFSARWGIARGKRSWFPNETSLALLLHWGQRCRMAVLCRMHGW